MLYQNIKCGYCKFSFTGGWQQAEGNKFIGPQFIKCPKCYQYNRTSQNSYSLLSKSKKINHWLWVAMNTFILSTLISMGLLLIWIILYPGNEDYMTDRVPYIILILFSLLGYRNYLGIMYKLIPEVERENNSPEMRKRYEDYLENNRKQREDIDRRISENRRKMKNNTWF